MSNQAMQRPAWISVKETLRGCMLCDSIYRTFWKRQKYRDGRQIGISSYQIFRRWEAAWVGHKRFLGQWNYLHTLMVDAWPCAFANLELYSTKVLSEWMQLKESRRSPGGPVGLQMRIAFTGVWSSFSKRVGRRYWSKRIWMQMEAVGLKAGGPVPALPANHKAVPHGDAGWWHPDIPAWTLMEPSSKWVVEDGSRFSPGQWELTDQQGQWVLDEIWGIRWIHIQLM